MRFTCDACNAQYMISDEKVGPNGVKVRCKKCGHIILVKRAEAAAAAAPAETAPAPAGPPLSGDGLDAELGQAFDKVLGGTPPPASDLPAEPPAAAPEPAAPAAAAPASPEPGNEWYVAVDDQQVGPLAAPAVKGKWESGEIGPDSLVWKPGLDDWKPLSQVPELQQFLAPIPRPAGRPRPTGRPPPPGMAVTAPAPAAAKEPEWKPTAASALAALAGEEMAALKAPEPQKPAGPAARAGGKPSLVDAMNLPEGGVDPTGAIPLPIKGLEKTGESKLERKSSVARTTAELRIKRSANRTIMVVAVVMLIVLAGAVGGVFWYFQQRLPAAPEAVAPPRTFAPPIPAPAPAPPAVAQATPPAATPPAATPAPAPQAAPPQPAPPQAAPPAEKPATPPAPVAHATPRKKPAPVPAPPAPAEKPAPKKVAQAQPPAPKKKGATDPFEGGGGGADDEFEKLLNEPPKRSVYVPPAPGGDVADKVSTGQIQEAVAGKMAALRDCLAKQQATDPEAHGEVTVTWEIEPDGRPGAVSTGKAGNQPFAQCLVGVVKSIRFPKSRLGNKGDDKVRFPFRY